MPLICGCLLVALLIIQRSGTVKSNYCQVRVKHLSVEVGQRGRFRADFPRRPWSGFGFYSLKEVSLPARDRLP